MKRSFTTVNLLIIIITSILLGTSCEYEPKGVHNVEVKQITDAPELLVKFNFDTDTVYVPVSNYITIEFSTNDPMVRYGYFELNQKQLALVSSSNGTFTFNFQTDLYQTGVPYILKIEFFRSTGSGSLADKYLQEGFLYRKEFVLIFKTSNDFVPKIISLIPEDGSLKIVWGKFNGIGFKQYHIFNGDYKIAVITDLNQTSVFDPTFIGYGAFKIVLETDYGTFTGPISYFTDITLFAKGLKTSDNRVLISWAKNKYVKNLAGYRVYRYIQETGETSEVAFITNPQDTSLTVDLGIFAVKMKYYIKPVARINDIPVDDSGDLQAYAAGTEYFRMGTNIPDINWFVFAKSPDNNCFYPHYYINTVLYKFNPEYQTVTDSIQDIYPHLSLSPDGNKLLIRRRDQLEIVNPVDLETIEIIPSSVFPEGVLPLVYYISDSNVGVIVNDLGNFYFYDFQNKTALAQFRIDNTMLSMDKMRISPDGSFFSERHPTPFNAYFTTELFKLEGSQALQIWSAPISFSDFDPNNNHFLYFDNKELYTISLEDLSIVNELTISDQYIYDVDWVRHEFLSLNAEQNQFSICDLETGLIKEKIETRNYGGIWNISNVYLNNKTLFLRDLKIQLDY